METFAKSKVEEFLRKYGYTPYKPKKETAKDTWISENNTVIVQLPKGFGRIDFDHFEAIAIDQVGISPTEFDYWLGENT